MRIGLNSAVVTLLNALGQGASFVLFAVIAALFGATWQTDAFFLALTIPALFIGSIVNAITSVLIPILSECQLKRPEVLGKLIGSALLYVFGISVLASAGLVLIAPALMSASGKGLTVEGQELAIQFTFWLVPMIVTQTLIGVMAAAYNAAGRFWLPPSAVAARFVVTLVFVVLLRPSLGVRSLPISFVLGALLQFLMVAAFFGRLGIHLEFTLQIEPDLVRSLRLALPLILGTAALQLSFVISRFLATQLPEGSVSILDYATRISAGIMELLTSGFLLVILADWSRVAAAGNAAELRPKLQQSVMMILFLILPIVAILIALRQPLVEILLQRGAFTPAMTAATAGVLVFSLLAIPPDAVGRTYVRLFLVWQATAILGGLSFLSLVFQTLCSIALLNVLGIQGLALASAGTTLVVSGALVYFADRRLGRTLSGLGVPIFRLLGIGIAVGLMVHWFQSVFTSLPSWGALIICGTLGGISYLVLTWLLDIREFKLIIHSLTKGSLAKKPIWRSR